MNQIRLNISMTERNDKYWVVPFRLFEGSLDTLALTSLNGHVSTDISTDISVEQKSETGDGDVSLGQEGGLGTRDE